VINAGTVEGLYPFLEPRVDPHLDSADRLRKAALGYITRIAEPGVTLKKDRSPTKKQYGIPVHSNYSEYSITLVATGLLDSMKTESMNPKIVVY